jgi:hypothetical protein
MAAELWTPTTSSAQHAAPFARRRHTRALQSLAEQGLPVFAV